MSRWAIRGICLFLLLTACRQEDANEEPPPEVMQALEDVAREQSQGLADASITVHRAYDYAGPSWLEPIEGAKLIAVDVEFTGYADGFDLDDVDLIHGNTAETYGSDPDMGLLDAEGQMVANQNDDDVWPRRPRPLRVLLVYAAPTSLKSLKLGYWGETITPEAVVLQGTGPSLPTREP